MYSATAARILESSFLLRAAAKKVENHLTRRKKEKFKIELLAYIFASFSSSTMVESNVPMFWNFKDSW